MAKILEDTREPAPSNEPKIPENESKAETFQRLVPLRVNNAIDKLRIVGNLANTSQYEYTEAQIDRIEGALQYALDDIMRKFRHQKKDKNVFTL